MADTILTALPDLEALLGRAQRDQLLRMGVIHGERVRTAIADGLAAGDDARVRTEAHRFRGAVAPFGAAALADLLRRVEGGEGVPGTEVDAAVADFVAACRAALDAASRPE